MVLYLYIPLGCSAVDVVMAIDSSGSIGRTNYYKVLDFAKGKEGLSVVNCL